MHSNPRETLATNPVSRRTFLRTFGTTAVTAAALSADHVAKDLAQANAERPQGPGAVPVTLVVNGEKRTFSVEPRVTLLEALRSNAGLTGAKEACDRGTCGACTVWCNGTPVYACSMLALEAQGTEITTIEGMAADGKLTALQQALVDKDGLQCGFCSPGMVMVLTALLRKHPHPTEAQVRRAIAGNLCRCGSYPRIFAATRAASGQKPVTKLNLVSLSDHAVA